MFKGKLATSRCVTRVKCIGLYINANQYAITSNSYQYSKVRVLSKAQLYSGAASTFTDFINLKNADGSSAFTPKPARCLSSSASGYLLNTYPGGGGVVTLWRIDNGPAAPTLTRIGAISIGTYSVPPDSPQLGTTTLVATGDCRTQDIIWQSGLLHTGFTENYNSAASIRYLKIDTTTGTKIDDITYTATGVHMYYPAVTVDAAGNMLMTYSRSSASEYISLYWAAKGVSDSTIGASTVAKPGTAPMTQTRWGDYTGIANDGTTTVWAFGGYAGGSAWNSWISSAVFAAPPQTVAAPTFNPPAGTYASAQSVTISTTTAGASIRYTTDGSTPTSAVGTLYNNSPVSIGATTTLKAIAYKNGMNDSTVTSGTYTITACSSPAITVNPANASTCAGSTASFSVTATGTSLTYQWQLKVVGGAFVNIGGATSSSYTTPATAAGDNGNQYECIVSGACVPPVTSSPATLTVNPRPTSTASGSATICNGGSTTVSAALTGTGPWNVTWSDSVTQTGVNISPATRSVSPGVTTTYTVTALTDSKCTALATDRTGSATITVNPRPASLVSGSATICNGGLTTVSAALTGTGPWNVTWSDSVTQTGVNISPATRSVSPSSTTTYTVTALDANCTAQASDRTGSAVITVNTAPQITTQPQSQNVDQGANVTFSVTATGSAPLTYQWRKGTVNISGATSSNYTLNPVTPSDNGSYHVVVGNGCGSIPSTAASLTVNASGLPAPWLTADIGSVGIAGSASASTGTYTVKGSGTGITGTADQFRFVYQTLNGDGSITARLTSQSGTTSSSLAGVMIRESTATGSKHASVVRRGSGLNNMRAIRRTSTGGSTSSTSSSSQTPPNCWIRITRTGNSFAMQRSVNGTSWTTIDTRTITMNSDITIGIVVTSGSNAVLDTDVFDNVTVVP